MGFLKQRQEPIDKEEKYLMDCIQKVNRDIEEKEQLKRQTTGRRFFL